jgi:hypothetical protein
MGHFLGNGDETRTQRPDLVQRRFFRALPNTSLRVQFPPPVYGMKQNVYCLLPQSTCPFFCESWFPVALHFVPLKWPAPPCQWSSRKAAYLLKEATKKE